MGTDTRLFKNEKLMQFAVSSTTDGSIVLTNSEGNSYFNIGDVDWSRIIIEYNLVISGGSSPVVRCTGLTSCSNVRPVATTSDIQALQSDGSTVFRTGSISATGIGNVATAISSTSAAASNIGKWFGVMLEKVSGTLGTITGNVTVYVKGK